MTIDARLRARGVFARTGFFDDAACASVRAAMNRGEARAAEIYLNGYVIDDSVRRTLDITIDPATLAMVERAFAGVRPEVAEFFGDALSAAEGSGFLRYPTGGFYRAHRDCFDEPGQEFPRRVSLILFLTDADRGSGDGHCAGGWLRLHGVAEPARNARPLDIPPVAGMLIGFRPQVLHEVLPVTGGVRDAIVDWFY